MDRTDVTKSEGEYLDAIERLANARVEYAQEWQLARMKVNSDKHAEQIAIENTGDAVTRLQGEARVMEARLNGRG